MNDSGSPPDFFAPRDLMGRRLGRYEIVSWIASGGMASVYVARALGLAGFERQVAIKVLHPHLAVEPEFISMFLDEARLAAQIHHPNVVATLDISASEAEGYWLVMDYVEGDNLGRINAGALQHGGRLPAPVVLRIVADALAGLEAAHSLTNAEGRPLELIHRDVSPHNILVGTDGIARLTDFGVARAQARLAATQDGQFKGKLGYLAPEQVAPGRSDRRSDLFAMGVVLWECLAGRRLFRADDTVGMLRAVMQEPIPSMAQERPELAAFDPLLARALARDPATRFQTAAAFLEAIEQLAPILGGLASQRTVGEMVRRFAPRRPGVADAITGTRGHSFVTGLSAAKMIYRNTPSLEELHQMQTTVLPRSTMSGTLPALTPARPPKKSKPWAMIALSLVALAGVGGGVWQYLERTGASMPSAAPPENDVDPSLISGDPPLSPQPDYPLAPTVLLRLHIDEQGRVTASRVDRPRPELRAFEEAALEASRDYVFRPAQRAGRPIATEVTWPVGFVRAPTPTTTLQMKGSDTIGATLGPALAKSFRARRPSTAVLVEGDGTGTAFAGLFDGSADLGAASRTVRESEIARAEELGIRLQEFVIGYDGISVIVHRDNPVASLSMEQLAGIFTGRIADWSEVGGKAGSIRVISRPSHSGTHAFLKEKVLRREDANAEFAPDTEYLEHGGEIVQRVAADPAAISYVGLGSVAKGIRALSIAAHPDARPVAPTRETVADGSYPIFRPLLLYTRAQPEGELREFLRFVLSAEGAKIVERQGFVAADVDVDSLLPPREAAR